MSTAMTRRVSTAFRSGPLAVPSFRLLASGQFASTIGDYCYAVALPWFVLSSHGTTILLGTVLACYGIPRTILIPIGGILADKLGPRTLMLTADILRCLLLTTLTYLAARHTASLTTLAPTAALIGAGEGLFLPASFSIMPTLLTDTQLAAGNALSSTAIQAGSLIGPAAGGTLVAATGASTAAFAIDAASFALSALSLTLIPRHPRPATPPPAPAPSGQPPPATTTPAAPARPAGALAYIRHTRALQVILLVAIAANLANGGLLEVALPALAHARWTATGYGALLACMAAGAIAGTLTAARSGRLPNPGLIASAVFITSGAATTLIPSLGGQPGAAAALLIIGACNGLGNVLFYTMAQRSVPRAILGRVLSIIMLCSYGTFPLSAATTGILVRHLGPTPFFPIAGIFVITAILGGNTQHAFRQFGRQTHPAHPQNQPA